MKSDLAKFLGHTFRWAENVARALMAVCHDIIFTVHMKSKQTV